MRLSDETIDRILIDPQGWTEESFALEDLASMAQEMLLRPAKA